MNLTERFLNAVTKTDGCWLYTGHRDPRGYGIISEGWKPRRNVRAHRLSWELSNGPIPDGMDVCHHCDNPPCVNPAHLFLGTQRDNVMDMIAKKRAGFQTVPECLRHPGSQHGNAKLNEADVLEIRRLRSSGMQQWKIAQWFSITRGNVGHIVRRQAWAHVE